MDELGFWNYIHATSSGFLPIVTWEAAREYMPLGGALMLCSVIAGLTFHLVARHRKYLKAVNARP